MQPASKKAFVLASTIHLGVAAFFVILAFWDPSPKEKEPVTFELFAPPSQSAPSPSQVEEIPTVRFDFTPPEPPPPVPVPPVQPPPTPQPEPPAPKPEPVPPKPEPKVEPKPPAPKPAPKPEPKPEPKATPTTYAEHLRQNPTRKAPPAPPPVTVAPVTAPRINTTAITRNLESMMSREAMAELTRQPGTDQAALSAYFERIKASVRGAWAKPDGLHDSLRVTVEFQVSADGRISAARVLSSSGNPLFDRSVLDAFNRAGSVGPSPDRQSYPLRLEFRMTD